MTFSFEQNYQYSSRRSVVISPAGAVASSQPLATEAGLQILRAGGTAADAAIAVAAALQVTQPCSTGLGGDAFCLYYDYTTRAVSAYNGSGRSPSSLTLSQALSVAEPSSDGPALPNYHAHTVTVPGAADAWQATHMRFGTLPLRDVLAPAVRLARDGFSVEPMTSRWWAAGAARQLQGRRYGSELMSGQGAPAVGERFSNPGLATVLEALGEEGADVFYRGWIASRIAEEVRHEGGVMTEADLAGHAGEWVEPISVPYGDYTVWECPPNGQGLAALLALQTYRELRAHCSDEAERLHARIEAMRLGFADAARHVADPAFSPAPLTELLSEEYAASRAGAVDMARRMEHAEAGPGVGEVGSDTVYFSVADEYGNGCSFINSNFMGFGTGIVPRGCGFTLQNRGRGFVLEEGHANVLAPSKRPYHTIIPGLLTTSSGELAAVFGVMGGMMQPQGHLQVVSSMIDDRLDPQSALDLPRWQLDGGAPDGPVLVEESMDPDLRAALESRGHTLREVSGAGRAVFGLGQIIATGDSRLLWCGSDPRGDGYAAPGFCMGRN
jgi:gamma-glutamyltranspeptidase/glutathione hydrolase